MPMPDPRTRLAGRATRPTYGARGARPPGTRTTRATRLTGVREYRAEAKRRLKPFRQGSALAVAATAMALLLWGGPAASGAAPPGGLVVPGAAAQDSAARDTAAGAASRTGGAQQPAAGTTSAGSIADTAASQAGRSVAEATHTIRDLAVGFFGLLPKVAIALVVLVLAALLARVARPLLRALLGSWQRAEAFSALAVIGIWLLALGTALSVIAGDARALLGSVGLFGLALSWALQAPIESFTGWLLNSFRGHFRVGDRIAVGDVFGDVYRIDFLTTTVWEAGGPDKPVQGAQPTGALVTFPNSEVLRSNVVNYTRDFPYVWDEVTIGVANESDLGYAMRVIAGVASRVVGETMREPAARYAALLAERGLGYEVATDPQVYLSMTDSWANLTVRYLVSARARRATSTQLLLALAEETAKEEHHGRIVGSYPVRRVLLHEPGDGAAESSPAPAGS